MRHHQASALAPLFVLMTLGPVLVGLAFAEAAPHWLSPIVTFGKVPLFYVVLHFLVLHVVESPSLTQVPATFPPGWGLSLPWTYVTWLAVVIAIYAACRWFAGIQQRRRDWWLGYL